MYFLPNPNFNEAILILLNLLDTVTKLKIPLSYILFEAKDIIKESHMHSQNVVSITFHE